MDCNNIIDLYLFVDAIGGQYSMLRRRRLDSVLVPCVPSQHCTSYNAARASARARCWKRPGPGTCTGTSPACGGRAKPREWARWLGTASCKEEPDSSHGACGPQYNREGQEALKFSKRCLRRKTEGGIATLGGAKSYVGFRVALSGLKGGNSAICCYLKTICS